MGLIRLIRRTGILNFILFMIALLGMLSFLIATATVQGTHTLTASKSVDNTKKTIPFETLTEKQLQEGIMVEGSIFFNLGKFTYNVDDNKKSYRHYAILLDDKVMSIAVCTMNDDYSDDDDYSLFYQADHYDMALLREDLSIWDYHTENNNSKNKKKKSQKNKKTVKQIIQETMEHERGIAFKGKVIKMDSTVKDDLRNFVTPEGKKEPVFEVIPYEIQIVHSDDIEKFILTYEIIALEGFVGIVAFFMLILRMRR